jgi:hypothetical protein
MKTVVENLKESSEELESSLKKLLLEHSRIKRWNDPDSGIIHFGGDYKWLPLKEEGLQTQSKVLEDYRRFFAIVRSLLREQPKKNLTVLEESDQLLNRVIEQNEVTYIGNTNEAFLRTSQALHAIITLLNNLYDSSGGSAVYVPDTNALLYNPDIEKWRFADTPRFTLALTPTVLSELDQLKVNHRVEDVRKKADGLINRIKDYRRRGRLADGVVIVGNTIDLIALAVEPDVGNALPWLDKDNNDDRVLAATIEIMRMRPRSAVVLVTRDINMQNKAEFARMPFVEPP